MNLIQLTLDLGSAFILFSTSILILSKLSDRFKKYLKYGALGTCIGCLVYLFSGIFSEAYVLVLTSIVTVIFWFIETIKNWRD